MCLKASPFHSKKENKPDKETQKQKKIFHKNTWESRLMYFPQNWQQFFNRTRDLAKTLETHKLTKQSQDRGQYEFTSNTLRLIIFKRKA